jgi:Uma2 family endonuclease
MSLLEAPEQIHRYSIDEYEDLIIKGAFEDQRVELIDGLLLDMSPQSEAHAEAIARLTEWLIDHVDRERYQVRVMAPIHIGNSMPEPDLMLVERDKPKGQRATSSPLVIEVAMSSRDRDLTVKPRLYAQAVGEYWVLDLARSAMVVHREPGPDGYREVSVHGREAVLQPVALQLAPLVIGDLPGAAGAQA